MDKLTIISGALFLAADIFAVASLAMPDWIVTEVLHTFFLSYILTHTCPGGR